MKFFRTTLPLLAGLIWISGCGSDTTGDTPSTETDSTRQEEPQGHGHGHGHGHHHGSANEFMNAMDFEELVKRFDNEERNDWQKPDEVVAKLGDLTGKTVVDLGAGSGYFTVRLAAAGANVIALDIDDRFLQHIEQRLEGEEEAVRKRVSTRKTPEDAAAIGDAEADMVLTVDTYHHFGDRETYFAKLAKGLKPGGSLVIIDFMPGDQPVGPPAEMKIAPAQVVEELEAAGFEIAETDSALLPHQFIMIAKPAEN